MSPLAFVRLPSAPRCVTLRVEGRGLGMAGGARTARRGAAAWPPGARRVCAPKIHVGGATRGPDRGQRSRCTSVWRQCPPQLNHVSLSQPSPDGGTGPFALLGLATVVHWLVYSAATLVAGVQGSQGFPRPSHCTWPRLQGVWGAAACLANASLSATGHSVLPHGCYHNGWKLPHNVGSR